MKPDKNSSEGIPENEILSPGPARSSNHNSRKHWDSLEKAALMSGMEKHGTNWNAILNDEQFRERLKTRTCDGLKIKWSRMKRKRQTLEQPEETMIVTPTPFRPFRDDSTGIYLLMRMSQSRVSHE
jgi:hypothetical protein